MQKYSLDVLQCPVGLSHSGISLSSWQTNKTLSLAWTRGISSTQVVLWPSLFTLQWLWLPVHILRCSHHTPLFCASNRQRMLNQREINSNHSKSCTRTLCSTPKHNLQSDCCESCPGIKPQEENKHLGPMQSESLCMCCSRQSLQSEIRQKLRAMHALLHHSSGTDWEKNTPKGSSTQNSAETLAYAFPWHFLQIADLKPKLPQPPQS